VTESVLDTSPFSSKRPLSRVAAGLWLRRLQPGYPPFQCRVCCNNDPSWRIGCSVVPCARLRHLAAHDSEGWTRNANSLVRIYFHDASGGDEAVEPVTDVIAPVRPAQSPSAQADDSYDDVIDMFLALSKMPAESHEYRRQRECIVNRCLPLADHVARHFGRRGEGLDDLTQVARLGLMNAINRFDPAKGPSFIGFAIPTMMGEVRRYFRDYSWGMRVPRRLRELHVQISRATAELVQKLGRAPTASELSRELEVPHEEIVECLVAGDAYQLESLDAPLGPDGSGKSRLVADAVGGIDPQIDHITDREAVRALVGALPRREREVLHMRFFESMTQTQIAERIGVSQMQVSRILASTLQCLRDQLE
jgi:RNA polymerase sigma-B factor